MYHCIVSWHGRTSSAVTINGMNTTVVKKPISMQQQVTHSITKQIYVFLGMHCILLTHWGQKTHICVSKLTIIGSDNGLSHGRRQAIIWINAGICLIWPMGTNLNEILIGIQTFSFNNVYLIRISISNPTPKQLDVLRFCTLCFCSTQTIWWHLFYYTNGVAGLHNFRLGIYSLCNPDE